MSEQADAVPYYGVPRMGRICPPRCGPVRGIAAGSRRSRLRLSLRPFHGYERPRPRSRTGARREKGWTRFCVSPGVDRRLGPFWKRTAAAWARSGRTATSLWSSLMLTPCSSGLGKALTIPSGQQWTPLRSTPAVSANSRSVGELKTGAPNSARERGPRHPGWRPTPLGLPHPRQHISVTQPAADAPYPSDATLFSVGPAEMRAGARFTWREQRSGLQHPWPFRKDVATPAQRRLGYHARPWTRPGHPHKRAAPC